MTRSTPSKGSRGSFTSDLALLTLRFSGVGLALAHGWPKVERLLSGKGAPFIEGVAALGFPYPTMFAWAAALSELLGGLLIAFGLLTRVAATFAGITMFVAAFLRHRLLLQGLAFFGLRPVSGETLESWGDPERAAIYLLVFIALALFGGGRFSLDRLARR
jgi:putative oxidoreductase